MPPGEETVVRFKAPRAGLFTIVVSAGHFGRCTVLSSTVPFALWTGSNLEIAQPGGTVYFFVPEGTQEFTLSAQCLWGTSAVKLTVTDPDGTVVKEQETDPFVRSAHITVPTNGKTGRLWSLTVAGTTGKSYRSVTIRFDGRLSQMASLSPRFVFS